MDSLGRSLPLTPIESTLKTLLLDVVQYIGERNPQLPPTVLRFTGGWVRDKLLGVDSHDIDVGISNMTGYQFGLLLKKYMDTPGNLDKYRQTLPDEEFKQNIVSLHKIDANPEKSKHLETVTTKIFGLDVDLVNLRKETYCEDSRNPQMEFGTPEEDALRRDATINALFYNLNESKVEDFTGQGLTDMESGIIRTPLEPFQTFQDDPLRVLRLIRFASRLGYSIDEETQAAMRNEHIGEALKLKISRERVGVELEKMLQGPDPRGALHLIDSLGLYSTIFANHMDDVQADTSSWSLAYNGLEALLSPDAGPDVARLRHFLVRDRRETYYAWMIAAFAPWSSVPGRVPKTSKSKPLPPRTVDVARDSLRSDNKSMSLIGAAAKNWRHVIEIKDFVLINTHRSSDQITPEKLRQKVGLAIRSWSTSDWRLCILLAILQGHMHGQNLQEVVKGYEKFISYIQKANLEDVYEMAPLVNGVDTMQAFGVKAGPWLKKAQDMVIAWQLSHPEITEKEPLRSAAREALRRGDSHIPDSILDSTPVPRALDQLWDTISPHDHTQHQAACENLLIARECLRLCDLKELSESDQHAANNLYGWANRLRSELSLSVIAALDSILPVHQAANVPDILLALASFTSEADPWTTAETGATSAAILDSFTTTARSAPNNSFWTMLESILKEKIRPLFTKTRNPAITAAGRKDFHPVPLPRFDVSILDPEAQPWQAHEVYATTVLSWIVSQYQTSDIAHLEAHFPLLIPPILALIDSSPTALKTQGCLLITHLLHPIRAARSPILRRTNLSSVFDDAIRPCLLSLPTITPEDESLTLLAAAYPALRLLHKTASLPQPQPTTTTTTTTTTTSNPKNPHAQTLRENLIPSFHHTSITPTTRNDPSTNKPSFPYPRLSTLLLHQIHDELFDLGIQTTKYLQDIIPLVYSVLENPFGTAYPPLLLAGVAVARAVVLNAHPRVWVWRGEILGAVCGCWGVVGEEVDERIREKKKKKKEEEEEGTVNGGQSEEDNNDAVDVLERVKRELKGVVYLLRMAVENPVPGETQALQVKEGFQQEMEDLVAADEELRELLLGEVDGDDDSTFFGAGLE
ncbi:ATP :tRNA-specific tRNA nucleotidyltransferase [Aspergillus heteromorphus CBS 117.55]|uniref:ATP:tRNA-specific tRNA nucleotidyltransferase n=1 Tax=Aspergillus heteromorphus CBS 117.55 TaxID=1448321 RepID=A0A317WTG0_9EURO|nr:ATP :tRNA-specific tRNA nucleotidyltransferase [Aspergillus heteromorphus CBS 117.55]PWY87530.1 ATP :tRNA-specific tRNA nucleotidyltransferase [Aspergillus heteromorphus CBS 117.55]